MAEDVDPRIPGWKKDPSGRFVGRFWDGNRWTDRVVTKNRTEATDVYQPPQPPTGAVQPPAASPPPHTRPPTETEVPLATTPLPVQSGRTWRTWQVLVVAIVSLLIGVAAGAGGASNTEDDTPVAANGNKETPNQAVTTSTAIPASRLPATSPPATTVATTPATTQPATKNWVEVITLSGTSEKRSDNFRLTGGQARLVYKSSAGVFGVYVLKSNDSLEKSGGFTEVSCSAACEDQTRLVKTAGEYYLDVKVSRGSWSVTIEELR